MWRQWEPSQNKDYGTQPSVFSEMYLQYVEIMISIFVTTVLHYVRANS